MRFLHPKPKSLSTISPPRFTPRLTQLPVLGFAHTALVGSETLYIYTHVRVHIYKYILDCFIMQRAPGTRRVLIVFVYTCI